MAVKAWRKNLRRSLADSTVADIVGRLSRMVNEAVEERLIAVNPCRGIAGRGDPAVERPCTARKLGHGV